MTRAGRARRVRPARPGAGLAVTLGLLGGCAAPGPVAGPDGDIAGAVSELGRIRAEEAAFRAALDAALDRLEDDIAAGAVP